MKGYKQGKQGKHRLSVSVAGMLLLASSVLSFSCLSRSFLTPETLKPGNPGIDGYVSYSYVPFLWNDQLTDNYIKGFLFGLVPRLGITDFAEIGLKITPPEFLLYYKHRLTPDDMSFICSVIGEIGLYSECPAFNQAVIAGYTFPWFKVYGGLKNLVVMGLEGTIFNFSFMGNASLSCALTVIPHLMLIMEYDYAFYWRIMEYGSSSVSLGVSLQ